MQDLNNTPISKRFVIGIFGRRNVGKSSLVNALTGQSTSVVSDVPGTTTDPVSKTMELLPIGPVVFVDTAGLDDDGELGTMRVEKSREVLRRTDYVLVVTDEHGVTTLEQALIDEIRERKVPFSIVVNKSDKGTVVDDSTLLFSPVIVSAKNHEGMAQLKQRIIDTSGRLSDPPSLVKDVLRPLETAVLVTPIDSAAPKGRLILPQQQTIRDILDMGAIPIVTRETELEHTPSILKEPPAIVITDSQAFEYVVKRIPMGVPLTSFSILFARQKSDLKEMIAGVRQLERISKGSRVLIVEACTHHKQMDDIATVKIPKWIREFSGDGVLLEWASGASFPKRIDVYDLIIHCGGCMLNQKEMHFRADLARQRRVPMTNYGVLIAYVNGILDRAIAPFPELEDSI